MFVHHLVCFDIWKPWRASFWNRLINYVWHHSVYIREEGHGRDWIWRDNLLGNNHEDSALFDI